MKRTIIVFAILLFCFSQNTLAQGRLGAFIGAGTMWYSGDLQNPLFPNPLTMSWTANAGLWWQINQRWGLQLNYTVGEISGNDALSTNVYHQARDLRFKSLIHEIGIRGTYDILRNDRWKFLPYLTAGVAALNSNPMRDGVALQPLATEGVSYSLWNVSLPTGIGAKYNINCKWAIKGEINYHWTFTDYLDDVSGDYPDIEDQVPFYTDPGGVSSTRTDRGNPKWDDGFWDVNIGVVFFFLGCKGNKNIYEDCDQLNKGVDMDMLREMYK
ncbi:MAG: opacity protein-like surface antigen [Granulosicoccus sp.]|jgi:opacity protein-like surface antigen